MTILPAAPGGLGRRVGAALLIAVVGLLATACSNLPLGGPPPRLYTLTPKSTFGDGLPTVDWQLVVEEPVAAGALDTDRIALRNAPTEVEYYAGVRWTERAPRLVQTLLVESFENSNSIVAVGRQAIGLRSDFNLKSELREFQADYFEDGQPPTVRVRLNVKLVQQPRRAIIASRNIEATVMAESAAFNDVVLAFDEALGRVLRHTVEWTLTAGQ